MHFILENENQPPEVSQTPPEAKLMTHSITQPQSHANEMSFGYDFGYDLELDDSPSAGVH